MLKSSVPSFVVLLLAISQSAGLSISVSSPIIRGQNATLTFTRNSNDPVNFKVVVPNTSVSFSVGSNGQTTWKQAFSFADNFPTGSFTMRAWTVPVVASALPGTGPVMIWLATSNEFTIVDPNQTSSEASTSSAAISDPSSSSAAVHTTGASTSTAPPLNGVFVSTTGASRSAVGSSTSSTTDIVSGNITPSVTVDQTENYRPTTPVSPIPSSSSSSKIPSIIGGVAGGLIVLATLAFFMVRRCLHRQRKNTVQNDSQRSARQLNPASVSYGWHVEPFTNTPNPEASNTQGEKQQAQRDEVARLQEQLEQATSSAHSSFIGPSSEESPLVLELRRRIQELTELLSPPAYEDVPEC